MPATVIYKLGYPSNGQPVETSATIGSDGLITGSAVFVVASGSNIYPINSPVNQGLFSSLQGTAVQNLVVSSRSLRKRNGLFFLDINVVGVINPPIVTVQVETAPRSLSKQRVDDNDNAIVGGFDYLAERCTARCVYAASTTFNFAPPTPKATQIYNVVGDIAIVNENGFAQLGLGTSIFSNAALTATSRILTSESTQIENGIKTHTKTAEFIYQ